MVPVLVVSLLLTVPSGLADESSASAELKALESKFDTESSQGKKTRADLAADTIKGLDALLAKHKGEKTDDVAEILAAKALLYEHVLDDKAKADVVKTQLKQDYPHFDLTNYMAAVDDLNNLAERIAKSVAEDVHRQRVESIIHPEASKIKAALMEGTKFPDFAEKDVTGKPLSIADYKGKVVLLDFWATWCVPCVHEMPNVIKTYQAHHEQGLEIIGVSLDKGQKDLTSFTSKKNMPWPQYFDGLQWQNKLVVKYGVTSIPATFLLDGQGTIIGKDLRGEDLEQAVAKALAKK
jgi:peroxiredoxin